MSFSINFQGNKSPLIAILDIFSGDPAFYPGHKLFCWKGPKLLVSKFIICLKFFRKEGPQQS